MKSVVARFLGSKQPEVLALKGAWGVGKTYAWNQLVIDNKAQIKLKKICYVSLFGIASIADLRNAIFGKSKAVSLIGQEIDAKTINEEWLTLGWEGVKQYLPSLPKAKDAPYLKHLSIGLEAILPHLIKDTIVCLDDFERLNGNLVKPDELLGFISELKEEKRCKVVLIFNDEKLDSKAIYEKYREKVIDIELVFSPTPLEAFESGVPQDIVCRAKLKEFATRLGVRNIRVLRKICNLMNLIHGVTTGLHPKIEEQAAMTLVLLTWCHYEHDESKPDIKFIEDWNQYVWGMKDSDGEEGDAKATAWRAVLENYGFVMMDEFDKAIFRVIQNGYVEESGISDAAANLHRRLEAADLEASFTQSWQLFHTSFNNNGAELVASLCESFKKSVGQISPLNLNGTVGLLRQLGHQDAADELIDFYVDARAADSKLFELEDYTFSGEISDPAIREKFALRASQSHEKVPLVDALKHIAQGSGWSRRHEQALLEATEDSFLEAFKGDHGASLNGMVKAALQNAAQMAGGEVSKRAKAALIRIGRESRLNAIRVRRYGVTEADLSTGNEGAVSP